MKNNTISYLLIILGGLIAFYAKAETQQNVYVLIIGIIVLMLGVYRLTTTIPSKKNKNESEVFNDEEE